MLMIRSKVFLSQTFSFFSKTFRLSLRTKLITQIARRQKDVKRKRKLIKVREEKANEIVINLSRISTKKAIVSRISYRGEEEKLLYAHKDRKQSNEINKISTLIKSAEIAVKWKLSLSLLRQLLSVVAEEFTELLLWFIFEAAHVDEQRKISRYEN